MTKQIAWGLGAAAFLLAGVAFAQTATTTTSTTASSTAPTVVAPRTQPMVLEVGGAGKVLLRGSVDAIGSSSLTVKSWGGDWTINVPAGAQLLPNGVALSDLKVGDYVGVQGTINTSAAYTVDASLVRDWTERQALTQEVRQNQQTVRQEMHAAQPRTLQGTLSNLSGQSFTLTTGSGTYTVTLAAGATILQKNWLTLNFSQVQNGDTVRVYGPVSSSTITASIFRDLSLPR